MDQYLTDVDARVLGALIEKAMATPDSYPLSLNALVAACNQTTNRSPVVSYDDATVLASIARLRRNALVRGMQRIDARVTKYEHTADETLDLSAKELALVCVLLLRGPNTVGELRTRTERLAAFESPADVEATLDALVMREKEPPVVRLARRAGQKEVRFAQTLGGPLVGDGESNAGNAGDDIARDDTSPDRVTQMESQIAHLQTELEEIRRELEQFRKQFE